jgi:hypothetical protein
VVLGADGMVEAVLTRRARRRHQPAPPPDRSG